MYLKLAMREREKHKKVFFFIIFQLSITFIIAVCCISIFNRQYQRYTAFQPVIENEGWFVNSNLGVRFPEIDAGTGKTGREVLEKYLKNARAICSYSVLGSFEADSVELEVESIVYDAELEDCIDPALAEGRWIDAKNNCADQMEAVISENYYGLGVGDSISLEPYDMQRINASFSVKIVGVLENNAEIIKMNYSKNMISYNNFIYNLQNHEGPPVLILDKDSIEKLTGENPRIQEILWPKGLLFICYNQAITDKERISNEKFIDDHIEIGMKDPLTAVKEKSRFCFKEQMLEMLPIFLAVLIMTMLSTLCVSVLVVKQHMNRLYIYRMLGMSRRQCFYIQFLISLIVLCESLLAAGLIFLILKKLNFDLLLLNCGPWQLCGCFCIACFWLGTVFVIQKKMLHNLAVWRPER